MGFIMERQDRAHRIGVRVSSDIKQRLDSIAELHGMPPSTLASMALSRFIIEEERKQAVFTHAVHGASDNFKEMTEYMKTKLVELENKE